MKYLVAMVDADYAPRTVEAASAEAAALFAAQAFHGPLVADGLAGEPYEVRVITDTKDEWRFTIETDMSPRFTAHPYPF